MAVYQFDFQFHYETEYWTNKFYAICTDIADAQEFVNAVATFTPPSYPPSVTLDKARITPLPFVKNVFADITLNKPGTAPAFSPAPLFNVVRFDFSRQFGRAVHHYMRACFPASAMGPNQQFTAEYQGYNNLFAGHFADGPQIVCDKNGNAYENFSAAPSVGMRQLRRGSKRKAKPVI